MLKVVQNHYDEYLEFCKKLVSFRSVPCEEKECSEFIVSELQKLPLDEAFVDGCGNAVGVLRGDGTGTNLVLNGHIDIVPEGILEKWAPFKPYEAEIVDGLFYGRGIGDMKSGVAAHFFALKAVAEYVQKTGKRLAGDIVFVGVVQEEPAEMFGTKYFFEKTMPEHDLKCDFVYISEPTRGKVMLGQRGKIELVAKTYGQSVHSSRPKQGINAYELMLPVAQAIFKGDGINLEPDPDLGETCITITNCTVKPGGNLSTVPNVCEIAIDRRYSTALTEEDLLNEFEAIFEKCKAENPNFKATIEPRYFEETSWTGYTEKVKKWHPAWKIDKDHPFVEKTKKALRAVGLKDEEDYMVGGTDGSYTSAIAGIPTILYNTVASPKSHQEQEYVKLDELVGCYDAYVSILAEVYEIDLAEFDK